MTLLLGACHACHRILETEHIGKRDERPAASLVALLTGPDFLSVRTVRLSLASPLGAPFVSVALLTVVFLVAIIIPVIVLLIVEVLAPENVWHA